MALKALDVIEYETNRLVLLLNANKEYQEITRRDASSYINSVRRYTVIELRVKGMGARLIGKLLGITETRVYQLEKKGKLALEKKFGLIDFRRVGNKHTFNEWDGVKRVELLVDWYEEKISWLEETSRKNSERACN